MCTIHTSKHTCIHTYTIPGVLGGVHGDRGDVGSRQTTSRTALVPNGPGHQEGIVTKARVVSLRSDRAITAERKEK